MENDSENAPDALAVDQRQACSALVIVECDGTTHYAGCTCHEQGWRNKWECAVELAAQAESKLDASRKALEDAAELLNDIMNDAVNAQDEAEKWLRAFAPDVLARNYASPPSSRINPTSILTYPAKSPAIRRAFLDLRK